MKNLDLLRHHRQGPYHHQNRHLRTKLITIHTVDSRSILVVQRTLTDKILSQNDLFQIDLFLYHHLSLVNPL